MHVRGEGGSSTPLHHSTYSQAFPLAGDSQTLSRHGVLRQGQGEVLPSSSSSRTPPPLAPCHGGSPQERERLYILVHQTQWRWQCQQPLPYPDFDLPHEWHLDPHRILVLVVVGVGIASC